MRPAVRRVVWWVGLVALAAVVTFALVGCKSANRGQIKHTAERTTMYGVADAGKAATLDSGTSLASLPIPAGSSLVMTRFEALAPVLATASSPAVEAQPAKEVVEVKLAGPTEWRESKSTVKADTGTIDTSVAKHRIDVESRQWLLWAAGILGLLGIVAKVYFSAWPTLSNGLFLAAVAAFAAWKLAEIPWYAWIGVLLISGLLIVGYKRREKDEREEKANVNPASTPPKVVP